MPSGSVGGHAGLAGALVGAVLEADDGLAGLQDLLVELALVLAGHLQQEAFEYLGRLPSVMVAVPENTNLLSRLVCLAMRHADGSELLISLSTIGQQDTAMGHCQMNDRLS